MTTVFINEIHYENIGLDCNEGVEIAGPAGTNLDRWALYIYDGVGHEHGLLAIKGMIPPLQNGFGVLYFPVKLPHERRGNAIALVGPGGELVQFLSWGASIKAIDGPANGNGSIKITKDETVFTKLGHSLQLTGTGNKFEDFIWTGPTRSTFGSINVGQTFVADPHAHAPAPAPAPAPARAPAPAHAPAPAPAPYPSQPSGAHPQVFQSVDLLVDKNRAAHHTDKIHTQDFFAIRRGQLFDIGVVAKAVATQALVKFTVYPETTQSFVFEVTNSTSGDPESEWFGFFSGTSGNQTIISISIPGNAITGQYTLAASGDGGKTWTAELPVYVLVNAWSKYDDVFLGGEAESNEYVLGEDGFIWVGSYNSFGPRPWSFSPYNTKSLQAALQLLQRIPLADRANVVLVSRAFSALVNSQDDKGVLVGNWSSDFSGGTAPSAWTGSADILKEYLLKGASVRFAQCWVYSGVLTTVCRAVGIPARSVTNFASAHDVPDPTYNRSVDKYFKEDGVTEDTEKTVDSVWNFHVWNDVWFARKDLQKSEYTGWQAIDATPQEKSDKKYQLGPVPLSAVKNGEKGINYDLEFVYSEVNADERYYVADGKGGYRLVRTITDSVGKNMSTKAVGSNARQDVTLDYKYKENSLEERASHGADQTGAIVFALQVDATTKLGQTIHAKLNIDPQKGSGTVTVQLSTSIVTYTGKPVVTISQQKTTIVVKQGTPVSIPFDLKPEVYVPDLKGTNGILFRAYAIVKETDQASIVQQEFDFVADDIEVVIAEKNLHVGSEVNATIRFVNPLNITLTDLELTVEGTDLTKVQRFKFPSVNPNQSITQQVPLKIWAKGRKILIALLDSAEINDLRGHLEVTVA